MEIYETIFRFLYNILSVYVGYRTIELFLISKKIKWEKKFCLYFIVWLINSLLYVFSTGIIVVRISIIIGYLCFAFILYKGSWKMKILATVGAFALGLISEDVVWIFSNLIGKPIEEEAMGCLCSGIFALLLLLLLERLKVFTKRASIPASGCWNLILLFLGSVFLAEIVTERMESYEWTMISLELICMINLGTYHIYHKVVENYEERIEKTEILQKNRMYLKQLEILQQSRQNIRILRHDLKNHLQLISSYLEKGEYEKAADYIESMEELQSVKGEYVKTGNVAVDSILNYKLEVIERQTGCKPQLQIDIPCESMISEADLNIVLGNLLDNAGEALQKSDEKHLDIRLKYERGILYLSIYNSFDGVVYKSSNSKFKTRKRDDVKHGYGLQSVERVVKKYSGIMRITHDEQMFCVDLYFYV